MVHEISRREVLNNLIRFKDNLLEMRGEEREKREQQEEEKKRERKYRVLLNRKTGDMRFARKISSLEHHITKKKGKETPEDWKEIHLIVHQRSPGELAHFEVRDAHDKAIKPTDMDPLAWRIASETVDILNAKAKEVKGKEGDQLAEEAALTDLSSIHLAAPKERIEDLAGWMGSVSRIDAEKRLEGRPVGTYILREGDEITVAISFHFGEENLLSIHPYILTAVAAEEKIVDVLILQTNKGWTLYHDDPNLKDSVLYRYFPTPQALLQTLGAMALYPLA